DAQMLDKGAADVLSAHQETRPVGAAKDSGQRSALELAAEAVIVRAAFLDSLLGVYARAVEQDLVARVIARDPDIYGAARGSMEQGVADFRAALERLLPRFRHGEKVIAFAQTLRFPLLPVLIGQNRAAPTRVKSEAAAALDLAKLETSLAA